MHKCKLCNMSFYEHLNQDRCYPCMDIIKDLRFMETLKNSYRFTFGQSNTIAFSGVLSTDWHEVFKDEHYNPFDDYIDNINRKKK